MAQRGRLSIAAAGLGMKLTHDHNSIVRDRSVPNCFNRLVRVEMGAYEVLASIYSHALNRLAHKEHEHDPK